MVKISIHLHSFWTAVFPGFEVAISETVVDAMYSTDSTPYSSSEAHGKHMDLLPKDLTDAMINHFVRHLCTLQSSYFLTDFVTLHTIISDKLT